MQHHRTRLGHEPASASHAARPTPSCSPRHSARHDRFGHVVRYTRARRRLSQEELGHRARLHRNYIGAIERGEINPTFRVLLKLALGLDTPLSILIAETEQADEESWDEPRPPC
jgi:ribosome-binding protein aMBF1 (putative translation factor)